LHDDPRLHESRAIGHLVDRHLYEAEREVERSIPFQELRDRAHPFTDAIADDQQQEIAAP